MDNGQDDNHLEEEVGAAVSVHGVALVAVVFLLGGGAPPDQQACSPLLPRPRLQGAISQQQLELARGEGVQQRRVREVVIILHVVNNLGAQHGFVTQETLKLHIVTHRVHTRITYFQLHFLAGCGDNLDLGVEVRLGGEGGHSGGEHAVGLGVVSLDVRLVEVVIAQVTREQPVPLRPVPDQQLVRGEVLFALIAAKYVVLVNVMLLLLTLCFEHFVAELAVKQGVD